MSNIIIYSISITEQPNFNISNDNIYRNISYTKNISTMEFESIASANIQYTHQTNVSSTKYVLSKDRLLYSNIENDYKQSSADSDYRDIVSSNENFTIIGEYPCFDNSSNLPDYSMYYLLLKINVNKTNLPIDYSSPKISYIMDYNSFSNGLTMTTDKGNTLSNRSFTGFLDIVEVFKFNSDIDAKSNMLFNFNGVKFATYDSLKYCSIVENNESVSYYIFIRSKTLVGDTADTPLYSITLNTNVELSLKKIVNSSETINEGAKYSLPDSELLAIQTTVGNKNIYQATEDAIVGEYKKGKFSVDLTCLYMEYKDENGNIVYTGKDGQMISVGDTIVPYYYDSENGDLPVATYKDGTPMAFKVYKSEIRTSDAKYITNDISALEVVKN